MLYLYSYSEYSERNKNMRKKMFFLLLYFWQMIRGLFKVSFFFSFKDICSGAVWLQPERGRANSLRTSGHRVSDGRHPSDHQQRRSQLVAGAERGLRWHRRTHPFPRASGVADGLPGHREFQERSRLPKLCLLQTWDPFI